MGTPWKSKSTARVKPSFRNHTKAEILGLKHWGIKVNYYLKSKYLQWCKFRNYAVAFDQCIHANLKKLTCFYLQKAFHHVFQKGQIFTENHPLCKTSNFLLPFWCRQTWLLLPVLPLPHCAFSLKPTRREIPSSLCCVILTPLLLVPSRPASPWKFKSSSTFVYWSFCHKPQTFCSILYYSVILDFLFLFLQNLSLFYVLNVYISPTLVFKLR